MQIQGRAWVLGDNIDTDLIVPGQYLMASLEEQARHVFEAIEPSFMAEVKPGDVIVGGKNFGCGSSREMAPAVLKHLGIGCILAEDFARIFFRNAIAIGLPTLSVKGLGGRIRRFDELSVSLDDGLISIIPSGERFHATPLPEKMREIIDAGGIDGILKTIGKK
ncbi:MAG TPA: 3-isopropylmalate dehydratase small subunit [Deltaproteobacteria bacterium]|nr:3-isopropylmalate dehydratase small subunit [Deltaproteobacteria bacterium]HPR53719.1 3-isopropylmalate dehydratase small subunit [Deltaproteobacteria bacterium]HXK47585.1 3-isopropylmalate dehydratase small subunit [Deltaproteobacteria bacterium]